MSKSSINPVFHTMAYIKPKFSVQMVNASGRALVELMGGKGAWDEGANHAVDVIDNWRVSHNFPLHSLHITLKRRATKISSKAITARRIKRLPSIAFKLARESEMKLSQMQDIGGCRAIMPTIADVLKLQDLYKKNRELYT